MIQYATFGIKAVLKHNPGIQIDDDHIPKALMFRAMFGSCVMALRPQLPD